jgi:serine/threonine protein phosphatase PrpC
MGTTVAGVVVTADLVLAFNVSDSRVYAADPAGVRQLSTDGLTDPVLNGVLRKHDDGRAVFGLWKAAVETGGPDNITIALVRAGT